ncbi:hypothetical protein FJR37_07740 [Aphanizomenon sp. UHCC 0183]|nr:hypothetical protein [Aphanizomenon sp. UHCC 0183]
MHGCPQKFDSSYVKFIKASYYLFLSNDVNYINQKVCSFVLFINYYYIPIQYCSVNKM